MKVVEPAPAFIRMNRYFIRWLFYMCWKYFENMIPNGTTYMLQVQENLVSECWWCCQAAQPCQAQAHLHTTGAFKCPKKCDKKLALLCLEGHFLLSACQNKHADWCVYVEKHQEHVWKLFPILLSCLPQIEDSGHVYPVGLLNFI